MVLKLVPIAVAEKEKDSQKKRFCRMIRTKTFNESLNENMNIFHKGQRRYVESQ
jgi:hypothetical protein